MNISQQIAKHVKEIYFGGNWTYSCLKDNLADVSWQQATTQLYTLNTIATLVYHINYYVHAVSQVLQGDPLNAKDELSFSHPPIDSQIEWEEFLAKVWVDGKGFVQLIEQLPQEKLSEHFTDKKYGIYYRNLHGIIEHSHYHLGQIALIKKILVQQGVQ